MKPDPRQTARIFEKLIRVAPELKQTTEYAKSRVSGSMDLNLDVLVQSNSRMRIALSHYYKHPSGDLIADPDMEIAVNFDDRVAEALTYQDSYTYQEALPAGADCPDPEVARQLNEFLEIWLDNLFEQGHVLPKGR